MKNKFKVKAKIKNFYRKPIVAIKTAGVLAAIAMTGLGSVNSYREISESINGTNSIIDVDLGLGSFVLINRDNRTALEIYDDAINSALATEGLEYVYRNYNTLSIAEKREFITKFVKNTASSAGIRIEEVVFSKKLDIMTDGLYIGLNYGIINYSLNKIFLDSELVDSGPVSIVLEVAFHEVIHGIENINIQTNKNVDNLSPSLHNSNFKYADKVYYSNFHEITAHLIANKFKMQLNEKYSEVELDYNYYNIHSTLVSLLSEIKDNDMKYNSRTVDYYKELTVFDIISIGIKNNYDYKNIKYSQDILNNSYTAEIIRYAIPDYLLQINNIDFYNELAQYNLWDLDNEFTILKEYIKSFELKNFELILGESSEDLLMSNEELEIRVEQILARQMAKVITIVRYDSNSYDERTVRDAQNFVFDNLYLLNESSIDIYRLDSIDNLNIKTTDNSSIVTKKFNVLIDDELEL